LGLKGFVVVVVDDDDVDPPELSVVLAFNEVLHTQQ